MRPDQKSVYPGSLSLSGHSTNFLDNKYCTGATFPHVFLCRPRVTVNTEVFLSRISVFSDIIGFFCFLQHSFFEVFVATSSCLVAILSHYLLATVENDSAMTDRMRGYDGSVTLSVC